MFFLVQVLWIQSLVDLPHVAVILHHLDQKILLEEEEWRRGVLHRKLVLVV
jgi:hypothetical protein